MNNQTTQ